MKSEVGSTIVIFKGTVHPNIKIQSFTLMPMDSLVSFFSLENSFTGNGIASFSKTTEEGGDLF